MREGKSWDFNKEPIVKVYKRFQRSKHKVNVDEDDYRVLKMNFCDCVGSEYG